MNTDFKEEYQVIASTVERVPSNTSKCINRRIREQTEANVTMYASRGTAAIAERLAELDQEWDIERTLETNASIASLVGLSLGATVNRKWFIMPAVVEGFLLQHAVQGWCPPMPVLRQMGFRTASEIDYERYALKAIRGDFRHVGETGRQSTTGAHNALEAARS